MTEGYRLGAAVLRTWFSEWPLLFPLLSAYWDPQAVLGVPFGVPFRKS